MDADRKIKDRFQPFDTAGTTTSDRFLSRLEERMSMLDAVTQTEKSYRRIYRRALVAAVGIGFVAGSLFTLTVPYLKDFFARLFSEGSTVTLHPDQYTLIVWSAISLITILTTISAYNISVSLLKRNKR